MFALNLAGKIAAIHVMSAAPFTALVLWFTPDALLCYHVFMPHAQGLVRAPLRFTTPRAEVWLTIDDGPDPADTPRILALLAAHGARATFFVIGRNVLAHPELVREIAAGGHELAHHTHTHPIASFWCAPPRRLRREIDNGLAAFRTLGVSPTRFRPPGGLKNPWLAPLLRSRGLACIGWKARGLERSTPGPEAVADRVLRTLAPGDILLLHEGSAVPAHNRVVAIERVLARLTAHGYRCVIPTDDQFAK